MTDASKPTRIAVVFPGPEPFCPPITLPFALEGYPPVEIELYGTPGEAGPGLTVQGLPELQPDRYDLVLDGDRLSPGPSGPQAARVVAGSPAHLFQGLVCQLQELRQKQEINTGIIHSAADALITINEDHVIIGYNRGAEEIFGYTTAEALGQDLKIIVPPPYKEIHQQFVRRYVATREAHVLGRQRRITGQRRDGREFPMSIAFSVAEILGNLYFTAIIRDITEYKTMEDRLLQSERLAAVGSTVTHIAHEIKNPLLIIGGFARQLLRTPGLADKAQKKLAIIAEEVSRLEEMVAEMRDFVHRPPAQKQPGQISEVVREVLEMLQEALKEQEITVRLEEEAPLPPLSFDPRQMHQVFLNLLKNAMEAMPRGGHLTIAWRIREREAEISVTDTGDGMPPEVVSNLFQPYFTTKEKGTGLGLAICQGIVQEHGGRILVESTPGQGSTFAVRLPLEAGAPVNLA